jgi:hypothetical protein
MVGVAGVTAIETKTAGVTVSVVLPLTAPSVAEIVDVPAATPAARPFEPAAFEIVAVAVVEDAQVAASVSVCVVESL